MPAQEDERRQKRHSFYQTVQDLNHKPQASMDLMDQNLNHLSRRQSNLYTPISPPNRNQITTVRGSLNQLLGIANPSTATALGGLVVGGVPLVGDFYSTPTPLATSLPNNARTASPQTSAAISQPTPSSSPLPSSRSSTVKISSTPSASITSNASSATRAPSTSNVPLTSRMPPPPPFESSGNGTESYQRASLPGGAVVGIAIIALLLVLAIILVCWYSSRRRRAKDERSRDQTDSFIRNNSLLPSSSFRGTPYAGKEGDMYYAGPPSMVSKHYPRFANSFRFSQRPQRPQREEVNESRLNEVNYLEVMGSQPRMDSLPVIKNYGTAPLRVNSPKKSHFQLASGYNEVEDQSYGQRIESSMSYEAQILQTQHFSFASPGSLIFPQVAIFRSGPKNEAGIPIQNLEANRIISQIAAGGRTSYDDRDGGGDSGHSQPRKGEEDFLPFYLPRAGDPAKIIYDRTESNQRSAIPTPNFSYPMPRVLQDASPPDAPGPMEIEEDQGFVGSTATPSFANNRYIPNKGKKTKQNAKVVSILHKSSLRKSSSKALSMSKRQSQLMPKRQSGIMPKRFSNNMSKRQSTNMSKRQSASKRAERGKTFSVNSTDIPDPYGQDYFG